MFPSFSESSFLKLSAVSEGFYMRLSSLSAGSFIKLFAVFEYFFSLSFFSLPAPPGVVS